MSDGAADVVLQTVARCRVRLQVVAAVRRGGITFPAAVIVIELIALGSTPAPVQLATLAGGLLTLAAMAAMLPSILRAPTMRAVAAAIDGRLRLQDRIVTAVQLLEVDEPMARLVVRDAATRLAAVSRSRVFPLETPSHLPAALGATLATSVVFLFMVAGPGRSWLAPRDANETNAAGAAQSGRAARPAANAQLVEGQAPSASDAQARALSQTAANRDDTPAGRDSARTDRAADTQARGGSAPRTADSREPSAMRDAGTAANSHDQGRGATGFAERTASAAGGVSGAIDASDRPRRPASIAAPASARYRDDYRVASARAASAVAQERVPTRLRAYVKRYFVAIHP